MVALMFDDIQTYGKKRVIMHGSFNPNGTSAPTVKDGKGFTVARSSVGLYVLTFARTFNELTSSLCGVRVADATPTIVQMGDYNAANSTLQIRTLQETGGTLALADLATDADNCVSFACIFRDTSVAF